MKPPFPDDEPRWSDGPDPEGWRFSLTPGGLGLLLFLVSLSIFFVAGLVGYVVIRVTNENAPEFGQMSFPVGLWISTAVLVASGVTMHLAQRAAARQESADHAAETLPEAVKRTRTLLVSTLVLGVAFLTIQAPALRSLLATHYEMLGDNVAVYGLTAMLITVHALHVLGGFVPLAWLTWRSLGDETPPSASSLRHMEVYWHFLHIIWILMFAVFLILR